jgi:hypothetical protein
MLANMSKVAQIIELSYELKKNFGGGALRCLWTRPGHSEVRGQVLCDTL